MGGIGVIGFFKCYYCEHYINTDSVIPKCKAYPDGIPIEILREEVDHTKHYKNDNGIVYKKKVDKNKMGG